MRLVACSWSSSTHKLRARIGSSIRIGLRGRGCGSEVVNRFGGGKIEGGGSVVVVGILECGPFWFRCSGPGASFAGLVKCGRLCVLIGRISSTRRGRRRTTRIILLQTLANQSKRSRHFQIRTELLRVFTDLGRLHVFKVDTNLNISDLHTKPLLGTKFTEMRNIMMGIVPDLNMLHYS